MNSDIDGILREAIAHPPMRRRRPRRLRASAAAIGALLLTGTLVLSFLRVDLEGRGTSGPAAASVSAPSAGSLVRLEANGIVKVLRPDGTLVREVARLSGHRLGEASPNGDQVLVTAPNVPKTLSVVSLRSGQVSLLYEAPAGKVLGSGKWSADGRSVYFVQHAERGGAVPFELWRVAAGSPAIEITPLADSFFEGITPLPDGRLVLVAQKRGGGLGAQPYISDGSGLGASPLLGLLPPTRTCRFPAVAPDGVRVAFVCSDSSAAVLPTIVLYDIRSGDVLTVPFRGSGMVGPTWSDDGTGMVMPGGPAIGCKPELLFVHLSDGRQEVLVQDAAARFRVVATASGGRTLVERSPCEPRPGADVVTLEWIDGAGRSRPIAHASITDSPQQTWLPRD